MFQRLFLMRLFIKFGDLDLQVSKLKIKMSNNDIMKKLRVSLHFTDDDIIKVLELANFRITKAELGAIFRKEDHPNFKPCGDQILRNFLNGLIIHQRGPKQ